MKKGWEVEPLLSVVRVCSRVFLWLPESDVAIEQRGRKRGGLNKISERIKKNRKGSMEL